MWTDNISAWEGKVRKTVVDVDGQHQCLGGEGKEDSSGCGWTTSVLGRGR